MGDGGVQEENGEPGPGRGLRASWEVAFGAWAELT